MASLNSIRIGVIGAGAISQSVHLQSLRRAGFDVRAVCDLSPSRAEEVASITGTTAFVDPAELLAAPDIDAVLIATPGSHAALAADALRAGKHVLAEKPLAFTVREVEELEALAAETGLITQVGYMKMFDPLGAVAAKEITELRGIRLVRITISHPADDPQTSHLRMSDAPRDADPAKVAISVNYDRERAQEALPGASDAVRAYYANVLNGSVIHEFSLLRALGIALPDVWHAEVLTPLDGPAPATLLAHARVDETAYLLSWNWLPEYPEYDEELAILAANGRLEFHLAKPYLLEARSQLISRRHVGEHRQDTHHSAGHETGFLRQLDAFAEAIRTGKPSIATFAGAKQDITQLQLLAQAVSVSLGVDTDIEAHS